MRALLIHPYFPKSFWSFDKTMELMGRRAMLPPLHLVTVAAILPQEWEFRLVDRNVTELTEDDWAWADMVLLSGMIVQKDDLLHLARECRSRDIPVAVGGPYATALPEEVLETGANYLVLDEGELTIPMWLEALEKGETSGVYRSGKEKPDVTTTPLPRFDLLELDAYAEMSVQFSRGCPFLCEFCDIIVLYGRRPRTKTPEQLIAELDLLYELGWRRSIFMVDDNFIGNKKKVKEMLRELKPWMAERGYPFSFSTEASVDLAKDQELMDLMTDCNFSAVFLGIETPDEEALKLTRKTQNTRGPLGDSIDQINRSGLRIMAGFIIGFDGEEAGASKRIVDFIELHSIPTVTFSMLQALPGTALTDRLIEEGRMGDKQANLNQTTLMNFVPTRPVEEIAREYMQGFWDLYDPIKYLDRAYRHYRVLGEADCYNNPARIKKRAKRPSDPKVLKALGIILWRQGVVRKTRFRFWVYLWKMFRHNRGGVSSYLSVCAQAEHLLDYREAVREQIGEQLAELIAHEKEVRRVQPPVTHAAA